MKWHGWVCLASAAGLWFWKDRPPLWSPRFAALFALIVALDVLACRWVDRKLARREAAAEDADGEDADGGEGVARG